MRGFWDRKTAETYLAELAVAARKVSRGGAPSWWLIDMGQSQVQSREVSELLGGGLPSLFPPDITLAIVVDARLTSVQAKRIVPNDHHRHFPSRPAAEAWLIEQGMPV